MEGINSVETSGEEQRDRITEMPDFILAHILSFLPTKDVVKMVLVPRFRHCWTLIRTLSFEDRSTSDDDDSYDDPYYDERFLNLVDNVLARHESSTIDKFHVSLKFNFYHSFSEFELDDPDHLDIVSRDKRMANKIRTWVHFAVSKKVKVLDLDLLGCYESQPEFTYKLPNFVLSSDHLTELRLAGCAIWPRGRVVELKSLKKLFLREIILSEKIMDQVLSGCPLLGELFLITCYGLRKLSFSNPSVKRLVVVVEPHSVFRLKISCPNVVSLAIAGSLQYGHLEDVSSLVDASISFTTCFKCALMKYSGVKMLLKKLGNTNTFAPCTWCILVLTIWNLTNQPCPSFCWKFLVLKISLTRWHLPGICTLLRNSHCLETLTVYVHPENHYIFTNPEAQWMQEHDFDGENYWNLEEDSFHCLSHHLRIVSIYGYLTERYVIELVEFLLKNAMVLETMVISTKSLPPPTYRDEIYSTSYVSRMKHCTSEELHEFSQKLFNFPRGSARAVFHFSG